MLSCGRQLNAMGFFVLHSIAALACTGRAQAKEHREQTCFQAVSKVLRNVALVAEALLHIRLQLLRIELLILSPDGCRPIIVPESSRGSYHCRLQNLGIFASSPGSCCSMVATDDALEDIFAWPEHTSIIFAGSGSLQS